MSVPAQDWHNFPDRLFQFVTEETFATGRTIRRIWHTVPAGPSGTVTQWTPALRGAVRRAGAQDGIPARPLDYVRDGAGLAAFSGVRRQDGRLQGVKEDREVNPENE